MFFFKGDHILVIGGYHDGRISDTELISFNSNDDECDPPDLDYVVSDHGTVTSSKGLITCGGVNENREYISKCSTQSSNGETNILPSLVDARGSFGMVNVNEILYIIGGFGSHGPYGSHSTMETLNLINETLWKKEKINLLGKRRNELYVLQLSGHCVVNIGSKIFVIGGVSKNKLIAKHKYEISDILLRLLTYNFNWISRIIIEQF